MVIVTVHYNNRLYVIVHFMFENLKENFENPHHLSIGQNFILNVDYKNNHLCVVLKEQVS